MKHCLIALLVLCNCAGAYSQNVSVSDYNVPVSKATTMRFEGSWNFAQRGSSVEANNAAGLMKFKQFYSSLPLAWDWSFDANGNKTFSEYSHSELFNLSFKKYAWDDRDWFGSSKFNANYNKGAAHIESSIIFGFGYGRYIEATPLAKAVRIEEHLLREGIILDRLPKETMIAIAEIIQREDEYKTLYGEVYETAWMRDIENEVQKSELLKDEGVGSIGVLRIRQVLFGINERVNKRFYGWDITAGFELKLTNPDNAPLGDPGFVVVAEYSIPAGWAAQFNTNFQISTPLDYLFFKSFNGQANVEFIYELNNRINFVSNYQLALNKRELHTLSIIHNLKTSFWYYVENNVYLTITTSYTKEKGVPLMFSSTVGLQYNLY